MKFKNIGELRAEIDKLIAENWGAEVAHMVIDEIQEAVIDKIASGSCGHSPTWAKECQRLAAHLPRENRWYA